MSSAFVIGLPIALRRRIEAEALRSGIRITATLADADRGTGLKLLPYPGQALSDLQTFSDTGDWADMIIVVLPYTSLPPEVSEELEVLISGGAKVLGLSATPEEDSFWPILRGRVDDVFLDLLYGKIAEILFPGRTMLPSEHFNRLARRNPRLRLIGGSLDLCDEVFPERHPFLISVANAFEKIVKKSHLGETFLTFFKALKIDYAPTGGMHTALLVKRDGKQIYKDRHQIHVKYGEGMAPQLCPRVYFHYFSIDDERNLAVMYVGPHPNDNAEIDRTIHI